MQRIFFMIVVMVFCSFPAGAETIYLKNGQVIKARITKDTGYSIQVMEGNFPKTYRMEEVDRIEPDGQETQPADAPSAAQKEELTEEKRQLIFRLMEANGARESMNQIFSQIISQVPIESRDQYRALFKVDEIISRLVPIYAKYYTTQDLKELITFYKSPVGEKHIKATPPLMQESMMETVKYFQEKMPKDQAAPPVEK